MLKTGAAETEEASGDDPEDVQVVDVDELPELKREHTFCNLAKTFFIFHEKVTIKIILDIRFYSLFYVLTRDR